MRYRTLGRTGLRVSELAMGSAFITRRAAARSDGIAAVRRGLELGLNYVDTAAGYSDSEEVLGLAPTRVIADLRARGRVARHQGDPYRQPVANTGGYSLFRTRRTDRNWVMRWKVVKLASWARCAPPWPSS